MRDILCPNRAIIGNCPPEKGTSVALQRCYTLPSLFRLSLMSSSAEPTWGTQESIRAHSRRSNNVTCGDECAHELFCNSVRVSQRQALMCDSGHCEIRLTQRKLPAFEAVKFPMTNSEDHYCCRRVPKWVLGFTFRVMTRSRVCRAQTRGIHWLYAA
jgi:hypothetical protein